VGNRPRKRLSTDQNGQASLHNNVRPRYHQKKRRLEIVLKGKPAEVRDAFAEYYRTHPLDTLAPKRPKKGGRRG
jgi:hypothetical protein